MTNGPFRNRIETLWQEMDKAFTRLPCATPVAGFVDRASYACPSIRLHQGPGALYAEAGVPDGDPESLSLSVVRGTLTLAGETRSPHAQSETEPKVSQRKARSEGRFVRRLTLTMEVDTDEVNAEFADAMLQVNLPKRGQGARRWISLQAA